MSLESYSNYFIIVCSILFLAQIIQQYETENGTIYGYENICSQVEEILQYCTSTSTDCLDAYCDKNNACFHEFKPFGTNCTLEVPDANDVIRNVPGICVGSNNVES